jgi:hypothetical protein
MKPSIFKQLSATAVNGREMKPSPRHWNNSILQYKGKLWMSYRYHLKDQGGRCALAIVELDAKFRPRGSSQQLSLSGPTGNEHHEDGRLFLFRGEPHISFTEMRGYKPGVDYTCVIRYAKLKLRGNRWQVQDVYQPRYGNNDGSAKEKNWGFFDYDGQLAVVYSPGPEHKVLFLEGERVIQTFTSNGPSWHWGQPRGGSSPTLQKDGTFISFFHSSIATEEPPHFVRYYGAAYSFEAKPPFAPVMISTRPLMAGSEEDGHQVDPRYVAGWKPYVVFPCGHRDMGSHFNVALGVNDWQCAIATIAKDALFLGSADGSDIAPRYFSAANGSMPVRIIGTDMRIKLLDWTVPRPNSFGSAEGIMRVEDPREAQEVSEWPGVAEIDADAYNLKMRHRLQTAFR